MTSVKSLDRDKELNVIGVINNLETNNIKTGLDQEIIKTVTKNKRIIMNYFGVSNKEWDNYEWQIAHRISDVEILSEIFPLDKERYEQIKKISQKYRWSISPYYLSLANIDNSLDEIALMCLPSILEDNDDGELDPMNEEFTNPAGSITRRYPDRLIINVTNMCAMYCRFCQRKRNLGESDCHTKYSIISDSIKYIKENNLIRDVLITGGDPFTLPNNLLERIIREIREIKHVEIIRIGTRIPITLPQRIDKKLINMLKKYHPIYINIHANHPREITNESVKACNMMANVGIPLGNQAVLLNGVNNSKYVMLKLNRELLKIRVKPYYIFQAKKIKGTTHFNCNINDGLAIVDFLRGNTSGLAIPTYVLNAPHGLGKIALLKKNYEILDDNNIKITTWEGKEIIYSNCK
jgi:glutamate 2,3-aminomutase